MKKFMVGLLLVLLVSACLCSVFAAPKSKHLTIGFVSPNMAGDSNVICYKGFQKYAAKHGWTVLLSDAQGDSSKVSDMMINYVTKKVDAIVVICAEKTFIDMGVQAADKAKIPVFLGDTENIRGTVVNATSNSWAMGALVGSQMVDRIRATRKGPGPSYICLISLNDLYVHRERMQMLEAIIKSPENKDFQLLEAESVPLNNWADGSYELTKAWISKYGKKISAIIGSWDGISWSIARAIADAGYTKDEMFTMSIDGSEQTYDMIRKGMPFAGVVAQNFAGWANVIGDTIQAVVIEGKDPKKVVPASRTIYVPYVWVDANNVPAKGQADSLFK